VSSNKSLEDKTAHGDVNRRPAELLAAPAINKKRANPRGKNNQQTSRKFFLIVRKLNSGIQKKRSNMRRKFENSTRLARRLITPTR
jgi:hypothetical protein